jgi:enamine deaminase RidA (YjgF/YER057c/UK114 family)
LNCHSKVKRISKKKNKAACFIFFQYIRTMYISKKWSRSGTEWEELVQYSRAVRVGNIIEVAGTTAIDGNKIIGEGDLAAQTQFILEKIEQALIDLGTDRTSVVRTRMYVTNIERWKEVGAVHGQFFKGIQPAATMVQVQALIDPALLIEIEATAIIVSE